MATGIEQRPQEKTGQISHQKCFNHHIAAQQNGHNVESILGLLQVFLGYLE